MTTQVDAPLASARGLWGMVKDPIGSQRAQIEAMLHPRETAEAVYQGLSQFGQLILAGDPEAIGTLVFEVAMLLTGGAMAEVANVAKLRAVATMRKLRASRAASNSFEAAGGQATGDHEV